MNESEPRSSSVVIGLDVGTSSIKAVAFGMERPWNRVVMRRQRMSSPNPGRQEQDPHTIIAGVRDALDECVAGLGGAEVIAVSVATAMHGLIGLDAGLQPTTPLVTWADARAGAEAKELRGSSQGDLLHRSSGVPIHPMTPLTKLLWFARHDRVAFGATRWWIGLKDWVLLWLTGDLVTELSSASGTGLLDAATRAWNPIAVDLAGIDVGQLPPIRPTTAVVNLSAEAAAAVGLPAGTPVVAGAGDGPSANLGCGAIEPGVAGLSLGTSGAVRMAFDGPRLDAAGTLFSYALTDSVWVSGGAISNGGSVVDWARRGLAPDLDGEDAVLALAATVPPGSDGLVMLPYLVAERAPLWRPDLPAAYLGLRADHTRAHLIRAAIEGVGLQLRLVVDQLDGLERVHSIRATGGAMASPLWREVVAAVIDRPVHMVDGVEGTALGAAALGLFALDRADTLAEALSQLTGPATTAGEATSIPVDPATAAVYRRVRASLPRLVEAMEPVARLVEEGGGSG